MTVDEYISMELGLGMPIFNSIIHITHGKLAEMILNFNHGCKKSDTHRPLHIKGINRMPEENGK